MPGRRRLSRAAATATLILLGAYLVAAYLVAPEFWSFRERRLSPPEVMVTTTPQGIPGDPVNLVLAGTRDDLLLAFAAAGWHPADATTLTTAVEIGISVLLDRPDPQAPVSRLLYEGRPQDYAFEKPVGGSADQRHHVRFWLTEEPDPFDTPVWVGAASFDRGVGLSHDTGQITHHIGPDVDAERDLVVADLTAAGWVASTRAMPGAGATQNGRNGGGDPYFTDGLATMAVLRRP